MRCVKCKRELFFPSERWGTPPICRQCKISGSSESVGYTTHFGIPPESVGHDYQADTSSYSFTPSTEERSDGGFTSGGGGDFSGGGSTGDF